MVTCLLTDDLAVDETWTTTIKIQLPTSASGSYTNTGVVTPDITVDPIVGNNTSSVTADVGKSADLGIVKDHTGPSIAGEPTTFSLKVTNYGPSDAATVTIVDTLPAGLTYRGFSNVTGNWSCAVTTAPQFQCDLLPSSLPLLRPPPRTR